MKIAAGLWARGWMAAALALMSAAAWAGPEARFASFDYDGQSIEQVTVKPGAYRNPILSGYYPDPSITRVGEDYYLVTSSFAHFPGLPVWHSKDLVNWTQIGNAIDRPGQLNLAGRGVSEAVFAPDISFHDGTFYIVNTCVGCRDNFVITAKNPAGPWSDPIWLPFEGIDPSIYWEGDKAYIVNNRGPDETPRYEGHRAIWIQEYDWRAGKMVGPSTQLINGGVDLSKKPIWIEGPHILRKDGWYYLTAAEGGTSVDHSQVVFRSRKLRGPYVPHKDNPILTQRDLDPARRDPVTSAGHAKLVQTPAGDWWATFLAVRPYADNYYNIGRETFLLPVQWKDGWPVILPHGETIPFAPKAPALPPQARPALPTNGDFAYADSFEGDRLAMQWLGVRTPDHHFYRLERGDLVLASAAPLGDKFGTPAFLGRRQQHHVATMRTVVTFSPEQEGDRAGLAAMQSDDAWLFFGLTRLNGQDAIALYARAQGKERLVASAPIANRGPMTLTIRANGGTMSFDYAGAGGLGRLAADVDARFLSTQDAGGFTGTIVGPYVWTR
ncbi:MULTISPECIES: glycoside hydrolase family 43 protein [Sphingobium]|uniref:glycoside hydrolase family 43 protein n=1 Tax=Sphingobium TaxID=165695 RepID=UPI0015EBCF5C|nr:MULTISPECIES: glycoside hydrolase family 43 protein [Sphingobium]MCW2362308.1 alpha-N-arabinofuranosidase [Sphingobium sp. B10D3B]MCW2401013.1 alpha-N-arabinofuranosidase [Sphingobium sp. B10D7B]MCW2407992.1 alpha-N-arabinofuranosidase [Sphingobium xanthum]